MLFNVLYLLVMPETEEVMTLEELAKFLKIGETTLYQLTRSGELPARKVGREWRYLKSEIIAWLKKGGEIMEGVVQRDKFGGEYKVENGKEMVALWLPLSLAEKEALIEKAKLDGTSASELVAGYLRAWLKGDIQINATGKKTTRPKRR